MRRGRLDVAVTTMLVGGPRQTWVWYFIPLQSALEKFYTLFYTRGWFLGGIGRFRAVNTSSFQSDFPSVTASSGIQ
jgi:hypothetical protein